MTSRIPDSQYRREREVWRETGKRETDVVVHPLLWQLGLSWLKVAVPATRHSSSEIVGKRERAHNGVSQPADADGR